ncbi:hypothetical protein THAOC_16395, partial [Thalassiosira oceanica]
HGPHPAIDAGHARRRAAHRRADTRLLREGSRLVPRAAQDAQARPRGRAHGGHGPHARAVRGRLHDKLRRRVRHAAVGDVRERRGRRSGLPDEDARHAPADGEGGDGRGVVPLPPRVRVLAVVDGHQHAKLVRGPQREGSGACRRPHPERQGEGRHRLLPADQPADDDDGTGAEAVHVEHRAPQQAVDPGAHPRAQPALLLHRHRLPQERARGADAHEPAQAELDGGTDRGEVRGQPGEERGRRGEDAQADERLQRADRRRGGKDVRGDTRGERRQDRPEEAPGELRERPHERQYHPVSGYDAGHCNLLRNFAGCRVGVKETTLVDENKCKAS